MKAILYDILIHGKIIDGEYHERRIAGLAMELRVFVMLKDLIDVWVSQQQYASRDNSTCEVQSLTFCGEN
jgi:hypothetical protein